MDNEVIDRLKQEYLAKEAYLRNEFQRSLSFQDAMFDRWERAKRLEFGEGTSIYNSALVFGTVEIGANTWVGPNTLLDGGTEGLRIGSWCAISAGVQIYGHHSVKRFLSGGVHPPHVASVEIGDCCFIGSQSIIDPGVTIGNHCLVACNSFVNKSIRDCAIVGGTPAKIIGEVEVREGGVELHFGKSRARNQISTTKLRRRDPL